MSPQLPAAGLMPYNFEIKVLLDPSKVLYPDDHPTTANNPLPDLLAAFNINPDYTAAPPKKFSLRYLDTSSQSLRSHHWTIRARKPNTDTRIEFTWKMRYDISPTGPVQEAINDALDLARNDRFDADETDWKAQVEWGASPEDLTRPTTLSVSNDKKKDTIPPLPKGDTTLPPVSVLRQIALAENPGKFKKWRPEEVGAGWGQTMVTASGGYGPVDLTRYFGTWEGYEVFVEVWRVRREKGSMELENLVEASFKFNPPNAGGIVYPQEVHDGLVEYVKRLGWYVEGGAKTELVLDWYPCDDAPSPS